MDGYVERAWVGKEGQMPYGDLVWGDYSTQSFNYFASLHIILLYCIICIVAFGGPSLFFYVCFL